LCIFCQQGGDPRPGVVPLAGVDRDRGLVGDESAATSGQDQGGGC
jgi:hypothetical protein